MDAPSTSASPISSALFDEYNQKLQQAVLKATRHAAYIPPDVSFHRSMDAGLSKDLDEFSARLLSVTNKLLSLAGTADATASSRSKGKAKLETQDDVVDHFQPVVVDCMDQLLERTDACLDVHLGRTKPPAIVVNQTPATAKKLTKKSRQAIPSGHLDPALQHASHIPKPQLSFKHKIENSDAPWYPLLTHKYNARVPLGYDYRDSQDQDGEASIQTHPYRYEIAHFTPPAHMFVNQTPIPPSPISSSPLTWVSTPQDFQSMLAKLRQAKEIAVDLEHHSYRSYAGFVCLMQLSTRQEDWIVDTLVVREELAELNEVFTDPEIVKVFHGAESDIPWLQQNFNLYVVNLFDTFHASKLLDFPRHGLANLLEMYCDFVPDKRYQLADWRIRPLPDEMLLYARADTHFLIYIYDCLRNALIDRSQSRSGSRSPSSSTPVPVQSGPNSLLETVIARSRETSLRIYQKEVYDAACGSGPAGWDTLARKWNKPLLFANNENRIGSVQRAVYRTVHTWRDKVAREEDESTRYVLPNHYIFHLAEHPPNDMASLLNIFPSSAPPVIRRRAKELLDVIRNVLRETLSSAVEPDVPQMPQEVVQTAALMEVTVVKESSETVGRDIWAVGTKTVTSVTAKQSSLFRSSTSFPAVVSEPLTSINSTLLGQRNTVDDSYFAPRFKELVTRINSTLAIAPSAPKAFTKKPDDSIESNVKQGAEGVLDLQVEIPFVPAPARRPKVLETRTEGTIVVGQTRANKRKRKGKKITEQDESESAMAAGAEERVGSMSKAQGWKEEPDCEMEITSDDFDFSAVSNILDDDPDSEAQERRTKQKRPKMANRAKGDFYGDFPAPPRAPNEVKGGNRSHTFKR